MRKIKATIFLLFGAALAGCSQLPLTPSPSAAPLGTLELTLDSKVQSAMMPQAALPDSSISNLRRVFASSVDDANGTRWLFSTFTFTNASSTTLNNLTFYAYHKPNNLGGTAINSLARSDLTSITDPNIARAIKPSHAMTIDSLNLNVNAATADFQAFRESEALALQSEALSANIITNRDSVLQYGFVARDVISGSRAIQANRQARITIAVRYKVNANAALNPTRFNMTFVLATEPVTRVTRSLEESLSAVNSRKSATGATEVVEIGTGAATSIVLPDITTSIEGRTIRDTGTPFTAGNLIALRHGEDSSPSGNARAYYLDVIDQGSGLILKTIPVRSTQNGSQMALTTSGLNPEEGMLTRSQNGKCVIFTGYNATPNTPNVNWGSATRGVGVLYGDGAVSTSTVAADGFAGQLVGGAASDNCGRFWVAGGNEVRLVNLKATTSVAIVSSSERFRGIRLQDFFAYVTITNSVTQRVSSLPGIPTTGLVTPTPFAGIPIMGNQTDLVLLDLSGDVSGMDTMYVSNFGEGIEKWSLVGTTWVKNGTANNCLAVNNLHLSQNAGGVTLYASARDAILQVADAGGYNQTWNESCTVFATASSGRYSGIALAPTP